MLVAGCLYCVSKYLFVFSFVEPATVRICRADFYLLLRLAAGFTGRRIVVIVILVLQRFLSVSNPVFIDFFPELLFIEQSFFLDYFLL